MLTKITLDNFKSFKNKTTVDLAKTNYTILPQNVADNGILKGCIFVGANASGKSTIILGVKLLLDFLFSERNLNSGIFLCMFGNGPCYSLSYEFLVEKKKINYFFEVDVVKKIISEKLWIDDALMLERMGLSAKSYIAEPAGVNYDEADVSKDTLFLRTLYFNTKFTSNPTLSAWMDYLKKSIYINMFDKNIISYGKAEVSVARYLDTSGCESINRFFDEYNFEQNIECLIRGMNPWPSAYTSLDGKTMKVWEADVLDAQSKEEPGTIVEVNKKEIIVATGSNDLALHEIQLAGKKRMQVQAFLLGYQVEAGTKLGE